MLTKEQIKKAALALDPAERSAFADELLMSIGDGDRDAVDAAWLEEVRRRETLHASGSMGSRSVEDVI